MKKSILSLVIGIALPGAGCVPPPGGYGGGGGTSPPPPPPARLGLTGPSQALTRVTSDPSIEGEPVLSPDGKTLLFASQVKEVVNGVETGKRESVIVGIGPGGGRTVYTSNRFFSYAPAWIPGGNGFVFISDQMGKPSIVKALSSSPNPAISIVVNGDMVEAIGAPRVSPDGTRVCFAMTMRGTNMIGVVNIDGSNFTVLTEGFYPSFSPDGKKILFGRTIGGYSQVMMVDAATGGGLVQLTTDQAPHAWPTWSPDGQYILFGSNLGWDRYSGKGSAGDTWNLFAIRANGTGLTQLTTGPYRSASPHWGADGWIYFSWTDGGPADIWRFQPALGSATVQARSARQRPAAEVTPTSRGARRLARQVGDGIQEQSTRAHR